MSIASTRGASIQHDAVKALATSDKLALPQPLRDSAKMTTRIEQLLLAAFPGTGFGKMALMSILVGCCMRVAMFNLPHSGQGKPPMHGDFEAQRHWMEVTANLPVSEWYRHTTANDLDYWGLDYPPLT